MSAYIVDRIQVRDAEENTWLAVEADHEDHDGNTAYEISMGNLNDGKTIYATLRTSVLADLAIKMLELVHGSGNVRVTIQAAPWRDTVSVAAPKL